MIGGSTKKKLVQTLISPRKRTLAKANTKRGEMVPDTGDKGTFPTMTVASSK